MKELLLERIKLRFKHLLGADLDAMKEEALATMCHPNFKVLYFNDESIKHSARAMLIDDIERFSLRQGDHTATTCRAETKTPEDTNVFFMKDTSTHNSTQQSPVEAEVYEFLNDVRCTDVSHLRRYPRVARYFVYRNT